MMTIFRSNGSQCHHGIDAWFFCFYTERGLGSLVAARLACHSTWQMDGRLPVSGVEGPSREIAASRRLKQKIRPTLGSFSTTNKVQVVEVLSPERVARNLTWTVGLSLSRARAPKLPKRATDRPCVKVSSAPIARQPESPFPFPCRIGNITGQYEDFNICTRQALLCWIIKKWVFFILLHKEKQLLTYTRKRPVFSNHDCSYSLTYKLV